MSSNRQNSLLVVEDWKKIYQTFREADFQSYDFETLRKSMIDYLKLYYPEDFNDFIESSEYIALIDLIAFLGQSLAFRTELNARENFLDTAERRDSILKLAKLINYNPKRNTAANGLLKINSVATTESVYDSNGINLANLNISWNDISNNNWHEQFSIVLNATLINSQVIGNPGNTQTINGIKNDEYAINILSNVIPVYPFSNTVGGTTTQFEAVSVTSAGQPYLYEVEPTPRSKFNVLYRNDNQGNGSNNTGFFLHFKQGTMQKVDFNISEALANRVLNVGYNNINSTDVWLYDVNSSGVDKTKWINVPTIAGINVIYNKKTERNLYQVNTGEGDQIDLVFGDGSFSNIPQGNYRLYFRTSNGQTYKITPDELQNVSVSINYVSRSGTTETLTIAASLKYTVTNGVAAESITDIKSKAPQQYYTQGRMITGEDYNILPYTTFSDLLKVKAVNRSSSGVSRYLDVIDVSGKYSSTNIFGQDGILYKDAGVPSRKIKITSLSTVSQVINQELLSITNSVEMKHFYYDVTNFTPATLTDVKWVFSTRDGNASTGYFIDSANHIHQVGSITSASTKHIKAGALIQFSAGTNKYFNAQNRITVGTPQNAGDKLYLFVSVVNVVGDGSNGGLGTLANGVGTITLNQVVPPGAIAMNVRSVFKNTMLPTTLADVTAKVVSRVDFGLRYDQDTEMWEIINAAALPANPSAGIFYNSYTGTGDDHRWLIYFKHTVGLEYTIYWRRTDYVFESVAETKFYFDEKVRVYDSKTGTTIPDLIKVLKVNKHPSSSGMLGIDYSWKVYENVVEDDGFVNQNKIHLTFTDNNIDGIPDDPTLFDSVVGPAIHAEDKFVFFKKTFTEDSFLWYTPITNVITDEFTHAALLARNLSLDVNGQIFYAKDEVDLSTGQAGIFYELVNGVIVANKISYVANVGRSGLYFQYRHNSPDYRRIDPSPNNLIDMFMLTAAYSTSYTQWIRDTTNTVTEPTPPTTEELKLNYSSLENIKAVSDSLIYNSAKFKPLFGAKADLPLQAIFKVVKNQAVIVSDNDIKTSVISALNTYFDVDNWDFGESFYFSELSAYLHTALTPNVSSIIIVPADPASMFGNLYQINAEANEILTSAATVDNVEVISAVTAAELNVNIVG
jgi:hypothetical protein